MFYLNRIFIHFVYIYPAFLYILKTVPCSSPFMIIGILSLVIKQLVSRPLSLVSVKKLPLN